MMDGHHEFYGFQEATTGTVAWNELLEVKVFELEDEKVNKEEEQDKDAVIVDSEDDEELPVKSDVDQGALKVELG